MLGCFGGGGGGGAGVHMKRLNKTESPIVFLLHVLRCQRQSLDFYIDTSCESSARQTNHMKYQALLAQGYRGPPTGQRYLFPSSPEVKRIFPCSPKSKS